VVSNAQKRFQARSAVYTFLAETCNKMANSLTADNWFKFTATHAGRDKAYRLVQYGSKFLAYRLTQAGADKETVQRLAKLASVLSQARKLFRIGKFYESYTKAYREATAKTAANLDLVSVISISKHLATAFYLLFDSVQWLNEAGVYKSGDLQSVKDRRNGWWALSISLSFIHAVYKLQAIHAGLKKESQRALAVEAGPATEAKNKIKKLETDKLDTQLEIVKNAADLPIPFVALKFLDLNDGVVGLLGTVSSVIGCYAAWPAS